MAVNPMLSAGANGIQNGLKGIESTAQEIAEFNISSLGDEAEPQALRENMDIAEAVVDLKVYQRQVEASAKVVQTADEVIGFLIDTL